MPRVIEWSDGEHCSLAECTAALSDRGFDPLDEESLHHGAGWLGKLSKNRNFLGDWLLDILMQHGRNSVESAYSPQAIMLSPPDRGHFLRANIWPSLRETMLRTSGGTSFVYGMAHDHNFDFLTVGYHGPGYASEYFEYDYDAVTGLLGEEVAMQPKGREVLSEGRMLHYRAHRDIHRQLPPESLSISLNIMAADQGKGWMDQYGFDVENRRIASVLGTTSTEVFLRLAVGLGGDDAAELARDFGRSHPSDRIRLASYAARAGQSDDADAVWADAEQSGSLLVAGEAARARRGLVESGHAQPA